MKVFCPLASGSKGNCIYVASEHTKLLIDAGISFKQIKDRLEKINVDINEIDAVIISHEHSDHIRGLDVLCAKLNIPILANADTAREIFPQLKSKPSFKLFSSGETFTFGDITIHPFSIQHDTVDPVAFTLSSDNKKIGICTDLGFASSLIAYQLKDCHLLYLESNHDPELVHASSRPPVYKQRVLSRQGHLSNQECAKLLKDLLHDQLEHVFLAHLSTDCNDPKLALDTVYSMINGTSHTPNVMIAEQDIPSKVITFKEE